jgi:hypothetical protein
LRFVIGIMLLLQGSAIFSCDALYVTWQMFELTDIRDYHSPSPLYSLMVPTEGQARYREIEDLFLQEDQTEYPDSGGSPTERTDVPLETYFEEKIAAGMSGNTMFRTYGDDALSNDWGIRNKQNPMRDRSLQTEDITTDPSGEIFSFYALKLTAGLIYKTDQSQCETPYQHPATNMEMDASTPDDHEVFINESGTLNPISDDTYCFFLLIPKSKNLGPFLSRVHELDLDSLEYIKLGFSPYLRIDPTLTDKLQRGNGDLIWAKGRYLLPSPGGKMLLPQNGLNQLFNRVALWRFYHFDRHKLTHGNDVTTRVWNTLNRSLIPPVPASLSLSPEDMFTVHSAPVVLRGLEVSEELATYYQNAPVGTKSSGWGSVVGPQYLALPPEGDPRKQFPFAMHFPTGPSERSFVEEALGGSIPINANRNDPKDSGSYGDRALPKAELETEFSDARRFQFYMKTDYEMPVGDIFNLAAGDESIIECDADPLVKGYCDKYGPLVTTLETLFQEIGSAIPYDASVSPIDFRDAQPQDLMYMLRDGAASESITVGQGSQAQSWNVHPALVKITAAKADPLFTELGLDQTPPRPGEFNLFMNRTEIGRKLGSLSLKLETSLAKDDKRYSDAYYSTFDEHLYFTSKVEDTESTCLTQPSTPQRANCMFTSMVTIVSDRYEAMELADSTSGGSFRYYTANDPAGKKLMTKLALLQDLASGNPSSMRWKHMLPPDVPTTYCDTGKLSPPIGSVADNEIQKCLNFLKEPNTVPVPADEIFASNRYPPGYEAIE